MSTDHILNTVWRSYYTPITSWLTAFWLHRAVSPASSLSSFSAHGKIGNFIIIIFPSPSSHMVSAQPFSERPRPMPCKSAQIGSCPITFLWLWPATDHESHSQYMPTNKIRGRTETTPGSGWRCSRTVGINSDYITGKMKWTGTDGASLVNNLTVKTGKSVMLCCCLSCWLLTHSRRVDICQRSWDPTSEAIILSEGVRSCDTSGKVVPLYMGPARQWHGPEARVWEGQALQSYTCCKRNAKPKLCICMA